MCAILGLIDYGNAFTAKQREIILKVLSNKAEVRGTDATGFAYNLGESISIYKRPLPAHKMKLRLPDKANIIMGHTRMTTQGNAKLNYNNHPFSGKVGDTNFALAHNGIIYNDDELKEELHLPKAKIETDSYVAVQLLEQQKKLDFAALREMGESLRGNFTITVLDEMSNLWIVKGDNPITIYHSEKYNFYIYASTKEILDKTLERLWNKSGIDNLALEEITLVCGEILMIAADGSQDKDCFIFQESIFGRRMYLSYSSDCDSPEVKALKRQCSAFGVEESDVEMLLEYGFDVDEIEEMFCSPTRLHEELDMIYYGGWEYECGR